MIDRKLAELNDEQLLKTVKTLKTITYSFAGILLVLITLNIISIINKGFSVINIVPIALLPNMIINMGNIKAYNAEIKSRNLK